MRAFSKTIKRILPKWVKKTKTCWVWKGAIQNNGYGKTSSDRRTISAHRLFYEHFKGPIPAGLVIDHLCRNKACVNPDHLEAVTQRENILRGEGIAAINSRKKRCKRGHALRGKNLYLPAVGGRHCRHCRNDWMVKKRAEVSNS